MKKVFWDTVYFLALLNSADQLHGQARALSSQPLGTLTTTEFVLMEVGDALSQPENRNRFAQFLRHLNRTDVLIVPASRELFRRGCELHAQRPDEEWSLTDCTSIIVMRDEKIENALTSDHHFEQASFRTLMKS
jgi:uncharacterized protein